MDELAYDLPDEVLTAAAQKEKLAHREPALNNDKNILTQNWPEPVSSEAYHGLAGDIVRTIEPQTEADPIALLSQLLTFFGNVVGRNPHFKAEADQHGTNLFGGLVGETAKGRKGTSLGHNKRVFKAIDETWSIERIVSGLSSGEGLIWAVRDPIEKQEPIRNKNKEITGYQTVIVDEGIDDKRLLIIESELSSPLKVMSREGNTLSAIIRNSWDSGDLRILTKNSPATATGAHISIIGHITKDELLRYLNDTEMANGFANRFLWLCVKRSKCLPDGGSLNDSDLEPLVERLNKAVAFAKNVGELKRDAEAKQIWHSVYTDLSEGKPGLLGAVTARAEAQVMRLACIYALLDCSDVIRKEHLNAGLAVWEYAENSVKYIFGDTLGDPVADSILKALRETSPLTRTDISNRLSRNTRAALIDQALLSLESRKLAHKIVESTSGRSIEKWFNGKGPKPKEVLR